MRLIDADALTVCKEHYINECGFGANFYVVHKTDIDAAPTITIESEPVQHGRWIRANDFNWRLECSECGYYGSVFDLPVTPFNYCPHCGAKMDLEVT